MFFCCSVVVVVCGGGFDGVVYLFGELCGIVVGVGGEYVVV